MRVERLEVGRLNEPSYSTYNVKKIQATKISSYLA